jgi:hypothetical protein
MDCKWLVVCKALQPSMLKTSSAQANAAKRVLRFTAEYLQKEIFRIVAASVIRGKVTKVTALLGREPLSDRVCIGPYVAKVRWQKSAVIYNLLMPESKSDPPTPPPPSPEPITEFHIGDEFGTAKRNLPPAGIVMICIAAVAVIVGIFAFKERPKPQGAGSINFVAAAEVPGQNMILAAITFTLRNTADRPLWIHTLKAQLTTADGATFDDNAASVVDLDRYYQAFPALKESSEPPLSPETKLLAGAEQRGTIIVGFKVTKEAFDQRKSLSVAIQPYDQALPVVLK